MKKLNIVQAMDTWYPDVCGPNVVVTNYCKYLNKHNSCVAMVPYFGKKYDKFNKNDDFKIMPINSFKITGEYRVAMPYLDNSAKWLMKNVDIAHCHSPFTIGDYVNHMGKKYDVPTVISFHTKFEDEFMRVTKSKSVTSTLMQYIMKVFNDADYVWTVSNGAAQTLREYGFEKEITVIRNGTDMCMPQLPPELLLDQVNAKYNLTDKPNVMLFVGRIVETKNLSMLLDALAIVKAKGFEFTFIVVGDGTAKDHLVKQAHKLKLNDNVIFTGAITDREFLKAFYLRSDLFLFPSSFDTASLVPIEAAAFSLPTLLIEDSPTSEIIVKDVNGFSAPDDKEAWASEIVRVLSDKQKLSEVSTECGAHVYRSWSNVVDEVEAQYRKILDK